MADFRNSLLKDLAEAAVKKSQEMGISTLTADDLHTMILESICKTPDMLQMMVNQVVAIQDDWPMPPEGWAAFKADIEYTNQKYGYDLKISKDKETK